MSMTTLAWLYLRGDKAIRMVRAEDAFVLHVDGPGPERQQHEFSSEEPLLDFQRMYEERLLSDGWELQAVHERRSGQDRRTVQRDGPDRRQRTH